MARIEVQTQNMRGAANEFQGKSAEWQNYVNQIWQHLQELDAMWDGDANVAFDALVEEDKPKFDRLQRMMEDYKAAITAAAERYDEAEEEVKNIVSRR